MLCLEIGCKGITKHNNKRMTAIKKQITMRKTVAFSFSTVFFLFLSKDFKWR